MRKLTDIKEWLYVDTLNNPADKMQKLTDIKEWFYVDAFNNPADMITRQNF